MSTDGIAISKLFYNATLGVILETNKFGIEYPFSGDELRKVCYNKSMANMKNTKDTLVSNEWIFTTEEQARAERRTLINQGWLVSLIEYDTEREMYVFKIVPLIAWEEWRRDRPTHTGYLLI